MELRKWKIKIGSTEVFVNAAAAAGGASDLEDNRWEEWMDSLH